MFLLLISVFAGLNGHEISEYKWNLNSDNYKGNSCCLLANPFTTQDKEPSLIECLAMATSRKKVSVAYNRTSNTCHFSHQKPLERNITGNLSGHSATPTVPELASYSLFNHTSTRVLEDCSEAALSGVYSILRNQSEYFDVYCDADTSGGPWTVIQQRCCGQIAFNKTWNEFKEGFGDLLEEFWIGNDIIHLLTITDNVLRIEIETWNGTVATVTYGHFQVADEEQNYTLSLGNFTGDICKCRSVSKSNIVCFQVDSLMRSSGMGFTTLDVDNDKWEHGHCGVDRGHGGWWFRTCARANLNGLYTQEKTGKAMKWDFLGTLETVPLKTSRMLIKRKNN